MESRHSFEYVKAHIENYGGILLDNHYINNCTKLNIVCKRNHEWEVNFSNYMIAKGECPQCRKEKKNTETLKELQKYAKDFGYIVFEQIFDTKKSKLKMMCPKGHECNISYEKFMGNRRCPHCKHSKGEIEIVRVLKKYNIDFCTQKTFKGCYYKNPLLFDFYLEKYNLCIEYDGEQHFEPRFGEEEFKRTIIRDKIKTEFCEKNNIILIRIPYWEFKNIEKILIEKLNLK